MEERKIQSVQISSLHNFKDYNRTIEVLHGKC